MPGPVLLRHARNRVAREYLLALNQLLDRVAQHLTVPIIQYRDQEHQVRGLVVQPHPGNPPGGYRYG